MLLILATSAYKGISRQDRCISDNLKFFSTAQNALLNLFFALKFFSTPARYLLHVNHHPNGGRHADVN
ncbi:MAG: hypothetical protein DMF69_14525 [Acidobacteria bacterium]|nr:MAG: hypothetical protein DMF69_14525 [Acidobacteriota bacterium]